MTFRNLLISTVGFCLISGSVQARSWVDEPENRITTNVVMDDTIVMRSDTTFREVRVANADVADVVVLTNKTFQVLGKKSGRTNVMLYDASNRLVDIIDVRVGYDIAGLRRTLHDAFPEETVNVRQMAGGLYISGDVRNGNIAERIVKIAQAYAPEKVTNGLRVRDSHQVMLEVRFVEATRDVIKDLGVGLLVAQPGEFGFATPGGILAGASSALTGVGFGSIGPTNLDVQIDALEENGVIRTLAEPNLVAMSGDTASFLAGGEFPIPVPAGDGQVSISFRQFGVSLSFTPTVLDDGIINLKVAPEVSQIDTTNAVSIVGGPSVPGLRVRRANTTVELRNSQSFAIAGLLENNVSNTKSQVPWLGDVPVLGSLFRSSSYQKSETELVIIVTPRLVQPARDIRDLATPLDHSIPPNEAEFFFNGKLDHGAPHNTQGLIDRSDNRFEQANNAAQPARQTSSARPTKSVTTESLQAVKPEAKKAAAAGGLTSEYGYALQ